MVMEPIAAQQPVARRVFILHTTHPTGARRASFVGCATGAGVTRRGLTEVQGQPFRVGAT